MPINYISTLVKEEAHDDEIWGVAWSGKTSTIVTGSLDTKLKCWDATTGELKCEMSEHALGVLSVDTHGSNGTMIVWDLENNGAVVKIIESKPGESWTACFSPDGESIVTGSQSGHVSIFNIASGEKTSDFEAKKYVMSVAFSPDGKYIAAGAEDGRIYVFDTSTNQLAHTFSDHGMAVRTLDFASDSRTLISGSDDGNIHVYDVVHGQLASILSSHDSWVLSVAVNPDISKQQVASASADGKIKVWDLGTRSVIETHEGCEGEVWSIAWNPEGTKLVAAAADRKLRWYASSGSS
ncbi:WD40-repeat-containing domain protein [Dichotomocladium elegans]|nr:WD40-repeat-containing domain protein [Dichotomocladium elegans]